MKTKPVRSKNTDKSLIAWNDVLLVALYTLLMLESLSIYANISKTFQNNMLHVVISQISILPPLDHVDHSEY